ncbi:MAG TPA: hypothetical protein VF409_03240 [Sphingomonas sp.]
MIETSWPEAANRRLRALLWKGWTPEEMSPALGRPTGDIVAQMRRLGIVHRHVA